MLKFLSLSSGSCGNCYFLSDGKAGIVIDAGVSLRRLKKILTERGFSLDSFQAILVTHDHLDHIRHLGAWCKHLCKPVYATETLHEALATHTFTRDWITPCRRVLCEGTETLRLIPDMPESDCPRIRHFIVPHDATQTVGYFIEWEGVKFFLMTDAGRVTEEALEYASLADTLVFESNYDPGMLIGGPYTHELKMRICRGNGHLSNEECAEAVRKIWHPGLKNIFLCHLSENNNTPDLAFAATAEVLESIDAWNGLSAMHMTSLHTLPRSRASQVYFLQADNSSN